MFREPHRHVPEMEFPVIVKPAAEDGSIGIGEHSVVHVLKELMERIDYIPTLDDSPP